jgi:hypothetical protein
MVDEKRFYTYAFLRKDGTPYYVGKGQGNRAFQKYGRKGAPTPADKSRIIFLKTGLTEKEAFKHEKYMIAVLGRKDLGTGILRNLTDGGEGPSGWVATEETRENMRKRMKKNYKVYGEKACQAAKLKNQKTVELTRMSDGAVFVYGSINEAARDLNLANNSVSAACKGKLHSTGGYLARYWSSDLEDWGEGLFHMVGEVKQKKRRGPEAVKLKTQKSIELTRLSDGTVFVFDSLSAASRTFNLSYGNLSEICHGNRKTHKGFTARYLENSEG